jgi:hypothetical protein
MCHLRAVWLSALLCVGGSLTAWGGEGFRRGEWPFTPLRQPDVPETRGDAWVVNPVDSFVLAELERKGLEPNAAADRATLLRRVTFDLTGLPPTIAEVREFLADDSPHAYEHVVDRLLNSPRFGERWARHWLDVVRFGDTAGFKSDFLRPDAWRYRDYVVEAFNDDLPYNRFVQQQIAGDELEPGNPDALVATGMLRLYAEESTASDFQKMRQDILDDITETAGLTFLGLTMGCAKCHDHKFDPIAQSDFYRMQACFAGIVPRDDRPPVDPEALAAWQRQQQIWKDATAGVRAQIDEMMARIEADNIEVNTVAYDKDTQLAWRTSAAQRTTRQKQLVAFSFKYVSAGVARRIRRLEGEEKQKWDDLHKQLAQFDSIKPQPLPTSMAVQEGTGPIPETYVLETGDYRKPEEEVKPGFPEFLGQSEAALFVEPTPPEANQPLPPRRSALARWLTLPDHPLTARVIINRLWQHHFGRGIVETPNDFGAMGEAASHPKLLDWLSSELVEREWSLKAIHRLMVTSATYRQSSDIEPAEDIDELKSDPQNKLLWHANRVRLEAEPLRDSLLFLSGQLNPAMGGPSGYPLLAAAVRENSAYAWKPDPSEGQHYRRSLYCFQKRNLRLPLLAAFDQPDMYLSCGLRTNTLTPTQSLALLNGDETLAASRRWAGKLLEDSLGSENVFIKTAWLEAYGRPASDEEVELARQFLADQAQRIYQHDRETPATAFPVPCPSCLEPQYAGAFVDMCHALLNSSEFLFVD